MMAAGGLLSATAFSWRATVSVPLPGFNRAVEVPFPLLGLGLGLVFAVVVDPLVFPRLASLARIPFRHVGADSFPNVTRRLELEGLLWSVCGWTLFGLSQVAILSGLSGASLPSGSWPTTIASVALATVAGFVIPIAPGGLGVREFVLWTALASVIDRDRAVFAALLLRLAWVIGEVVAAAILWPLVRPAPVSRHGAP
jgi:uncharacterized membrane protein YbhN (UPF0104 family)